jgi:hypothetical protein
MGNQHEGIIEYFRPPTDYYWRWTDAGYVIEWRQGDTICYREDVLAVLKKLAAEGWPPLGSILLVLSACRENVGTIGLHEYWDRVRPGKDKDELDIIIEFLKMVAALPVELRTGNNRIWLLYIIFKKVSVRIKADNTAYYLNVFNSGRIDRIVFGEYLPGEEQAPYYNGFAFNDDIGWLSDAYESFPTLADMERAVRTGLPELPEAAEFEEPEQETGDLLEQLEQDPNTAGLAQLTHRLVAALNIPMHAHGSSDQLFGGVSDITNRGNFDRLLLSELAHDDLSLMARLANNEALYLRREELPSHPEKQRILLIDTTIKMWGLPRVFAVSAALACARNNKAKAQVLSYALFGNRFKVVDLTTKDGVVNSLEQLDAALHCGRGLTSFMDQAKLSQEDEVFLITEEEATHSVMFQSILSSLKKPVNFLVTVNRGGRLQFYEYSRGHRKLLSEAKFDLQELLFNTKAKKKTWKKRHLSHDLPMFFHELRHPLFFPASKIKFNSDCFYELKRDHVVGVTIDQRVMYWNSRTRGARQFIEYLEPGRFCIGSNGAAMIYILVYSGSAKCCRLYKVSTESGNVEMIKLPETFAQVNEMAFDGGYFYIKANDHLFSVEADTGAIYAGASKLSRFSEIVLRYKNRPVNISYFKKLINDGYTTLSSVKSVYINHDGGLAFDDRHIALGYKSETILIKHNNEDRHKKMKAWNTSEEEVPALLFNTNIKYARFVWADGSEVLADSRGLLHLRSSDKTIPEITIVMIMGKPTACWAADGRVCGPAYFTGVDNEESRDAAGFYNNYIQRFIDTVINHGANN